MFAESCIWQINSCPYAICGLLRLWCDFHYDTLHSRTHSHWLKSINACTLEEIMTRVNLKIINNMLRGLLGANPCSCFEGSQDFGQVTVVFVHFQGHNFASAHETFI